MKDGFPGFKECMALMRKHSPMLQEEGFHWLRPRAGEFLAELIAEFQVEKEPGLRCWLLELIGEARAPEALPIFAENLRSTDEGLRQWAIHGLVSLGTPEARRLLWDARSYTFGTSLATQSFQGELAHAVRNRGRTMH